MICRSLDVGPRDRVSRAGSLDEREIDAESLGQVAHERRVRAFGARYDLTMGRWRRGDRG